MLRPTTAEAAGLAELPTCPTSGQACVAVKVVEEGQQPHVTFVPADELAGSGADVNNQGYAVPNSASVSVSSGTSVAKLITDAGVDLSDVHFAEVDAADGYGRHLLTAGELRPPGQGDQAPVLYPNPQGNATDFVNFVRADRGGDDDQLEAGPGLGFFQSDQDASLEIVVHLSGQPLDVTVTATPVPGGNDRSFTLSSQPGGGGLTTTWVFPDGSTSQDPTPTYTFPAGSQAGSYPFSVAVEDPSDGSFGGAQTFVRVGPAATPSASASQTGSGGDGGNHHGGTHGGHGPSSNPSPGVGHGGSATASPTASASAGASSQSSQLPAQPTSLPSSTASVPATDGPLTAPARPSHTPAATPSPTATPSASSGTTVAGVLLADDRAAAVPSGGADVSDVPVSNSAAAPALEPHFRVDPLVWLAIAGVLLLGAGAASESDRLRRAVTTRLRRWARIEA